MPVVRRRTTAPRRSAARRRTTWATSLTQGLAVASGVSATPIDLLAGLEAPGVGIIGGTVGRIHGRLALGTLAADGNPGATYGLVVWDKTPASVKPNAHSDFYVDWMLHQALAPGVAGPGQAVQSGIQLTFGDNIDIRAKRRLHEMNDSLFFALFNEGTSTLTFSLFVRTLILLP
jgi:hypothetical protein